MCDVWLISKWSWVLIDEKIGNSCKDSDEGYKVGYCRNILFGQKHVYIGAILHRSIMNQSFLPSKVNQIWWESVFVKFSFVCEITRQPERNSSFTVSWQSKNALYYFLKKVPCREFYLHKPFLTHFYYIFQKFDTIW